MVGSGHPLSVMTKGKYTSNGCQCCHSASLDWKTIEWSSCVNKPEFDELDFSCVVLSALSMCIYKPLSLVFCVRCKLLLDLKGPHAHAEGRHQATLPRVQPGGVNKYESLIAHVTKAFDIPEHFVPPHHLTVHHPIPLFDKPKRYFKCPNPECQSVWLSKTPIMGIKNLRAHLKSTEACNKSDKVQQLQTAAKWTSQQCQLLGNIPAKKWEPFLTTAPTYGQVAYPGRNGTKQILAFCPNGWAPPVILGLWGLFV